MIRTGGQSKETRGWAYPRRWQILLFLVAVVLVQTEFASAQTKRVVLIKVDGLPHELLDSFVKERDPRTGKSELPWFDYIFYQRGARVANFYTRGMSLSAPSWSTIDTGQHLQIKGNVEFDRYTLHAYDYLNFIPFYLKSAVGARIDMPGAEVLDSLGIPMLVDAFPHENRYISFQLYQRGMRFATLKDAIQKRFMKAPKELLDEWTMGLDMRTPFFDQMERELEQKLGDTHTQYLDLYVSGFDHLAHHVYDRKSQLTEVQAIDAVLGRVWTAIQKSPLAQQTAIIVISDHGFNSTEGVYSQGYNLVKLLGTPAGGGHHVITKRRLMLDYSIKGINFVVPLITTTTEDSFYLQKQSTNYPTALLDFDGNERASLHLRDSDLNVLHILLQQMQRNRLSPPIYNAVVDGFFQILDTRRPQWQTRLDELNEELVALRHSIDKQQKLWEAEPKKFTPEEIRLGRDDQKKRVYAQLERWISQDRTYTEYARTLANLLALQKVGFVSAKVTIEDVIAKGAMGERNTIHELQNYVVGLNPGGLQIKSDGSLDFDNSFKRVDYFALLHDVTIRNNVQPQVANKPIDMLATRISSALVTPMIEEHGLTPDVVWVYGGPDNQALILAREDEKGTLSLRYQPIRNLRQDAAGRLQFDFVPWTPGLPLRIFEDPQLTIPTRDRASWLSQWHTDLEWLRALHKTKYSNGLIGYYEEMAQHPNENLSLDQPGLSVDERLMRRFTKRQRELIETDLLIMANDHWNFDVRGFNPGGNHGSFFRISTHSTLMFAGGDSTGIPRGLEIEEPYDSLSFTPTVLALTGNIRDDNNPISALWDKGFRHFPGRLVNEVLSRGENQKSAPAGAVATP